MAAVGVAEGEEVDPIAVDVGHMLLEDLYRAGEFAALEHRLALLEGDLDVQQVELPLVGVAAARGGVTQEAGQQYAAGQRRAEKNPGHDRILAGRRIRRRGVRRRE